MEHNSVPPIAALFLVVFDQKVGYTVAWNRTLPGVSSDGVEYKSLPSGLHGVKSDLVYFVHGEGGQYAGVSAFARGVADAQHRNASFVAVGALALASREVLGRGWMHAAELKRLVGTLVEDTGDTRALELYWRKHGLEAGQGEAPASAARGLLPDPQKRQPGFDSAPTGLRLDVEAAADQPALHWPALLDTFGPLVFPLYRAALLRKRILLLGTPPVQSNCNIVYILSTLARISQAAREVLPPDTRQFWLPTHPLFSVGVPDIDTLLSHDGSKSGYLATTTDDILGEKPQLWDVFVELPPHGTGSRKRWPRLRMSEGGLLVKATQRDRRRYRSLRADLQRWRHLRGPHRDDEDDEGVQGGDETPLLARRTSVSIKDLADAQEGVSNSESEVVEPVSWTAMAYDSFIWWASAGEDAEEWEREERDIDWQLLKDASNLQDFMSVPPTHSGTPKGDDGRERFEAQEMAALVVDYFQLLTTRVLQVLADVVANADDETEQGIEEEAIVVHAEEVKKLGLDTSSEGDRAFVKEMMRVWFGKEAAVDEGGMRLCGVRVC
ncbi:hypothetical protein LTR08_003745 [Meristemomyces frigidus]|nr:hypothetical protein LTR08_003745 [Meristemomyces frigidus]